MTTQEFIAKKEKIKKWLSLEFVDTPRLQEILDEERFNDLKITIQTNLFDYLMDACRDKDFCKQTLTEIIQEELSEREF